MGAPLRSGCCCEVFLGYDATAERPVTTRTAVHHCCPTHGKPASTSGNTR